MRLVTKALLILSLVVLCLAVLWYAGRRDGPAGDPFGPTSARNETGRTKFDDPLAGLERWREQFTRFARGGNPGPDEPAAEGVQPQAEPEGPPRPRPRQDLHDLESTAVDEGVAVLRPRGEVLGADPPGPVLRPAGLRGRVVTRRLVPEREEQQPLGRAHEVTDGDTVYDIAIQYYGDPGYVEHILAANPGVDPQALRIGERISLPDRNRPATPKPEAPAEPKVYVVRPNDTLIRIASRIYGDSSMYLNIYEVNRDRLASPNATLYVGQRLRLPDPPR